MLSLGAGVAQSGSGTGVADGEAVGVTDALDEGDRDGEGVRVALSEADGDADGATDCDGPAVMHGVGATVGKARVGSALPKLDGRAASPRRSISAFS